MVYELVAIITKDRDRVLAGAGIGVGVRFA